jgi:hypothetical protein
MLLNDNERTSLRRMPVLYINVVSSTVNDQTPLTR